jgi:UDP-N-acetylglucosamine 2-epimerase (non-hydrolysing)
VGVVADMHLVPTRRALNSLLNEHVPRDRIVVVGNTVVDAVLQMAKQRDPIADPRLNDIVRLATQGRARLMLVTAHRRESWGAPLDRVLVAVDQIVRDHPDLHCVLPVHPNPQVREQVCRALHAHPRVVLTTPLPYPVLCRLLARATLVLTDSGGIQEEAPSFRVPTLVLRDVTERMEAVQAGWAQLVGTDTGRPLAIRSATATPPLVPRKRSRTCSARRICPRSSNSLGKIRAVPSLAHRTADLHVCRSRERSQNRSASLTLMIR